MKAIDTLYDLIDLLRAVYRERQDAIEIEYLYLFFALLRQLETTLNRQTADAGGKTAVTVRSFKQFLYELIRQTSIPFTSEGRSQLQVMGMLETRALDFDRVIILSVNEGILPQSRKLNSLLPFDIASELGLPTYREQESVMAYHFYRLLQRASEIVLLHTTSTDAYGNSKGERSRFIRQIEHELVPRSKGLIRISHPTVRFGRPGTEKIADLTDLSVPKTAAIRADLIKLLTTRGLYPSYLNQFVSCSMRFYFSRLVKIAEEEDIEEKMGAADFGNWMHLVLERLDKEYRLLNKPVDEPLIVRLLEDEFANTMRGRVIESGINLLLYDLAKKLMLDFQRQQSDLAGLIVIGTEQTLDTYIDVPLNGHLPHPYSMGHPTLRVRIAGKIDRIEQYGGQIRIVDYKTGSVKLDNKTPKDLADKLLNDGSADKMRQLWLYRYLTLKNIRDYGGLPLNRDIADVYPAGNMPVEAGFYSFRDIPGGFKTNPVRFGEDDTPEQYIQHSEDLLRQIIQRLFDPSEPFRKTDQIETCQYCDFKGICGR
jgi:RecB family exonuclease